MILTVKDRDTDILFVTILRGYMTDYQIRDTIAAQGAGGDYLNPDGFHTQACQMPQNITCFIFNQVF